jgi:hypothetical protein
VGHREIAIELQRRAAAPTGSTSPMARASTAFDFAQRLDDPVVTFSAADDALMHPSTRQDSRRLRLSKPAKSFSGFELTVRRRGARPRPSITRMPICVVFRSAHGPGDSAGPRWQRSRAVASSIAALAGRFIRRSARCDPARPVDELRLLQRDRQRFPHRATAGVGRRVHEIADGTKSRAWNVARTGGSQRSR